MSHDLKKAQGVAECEAMHSYDVSPADEKVDIYSDGYISGYQAGAEREQEINQNPPGSYFKKWIDEKYPNHSIYGVGDLLKAWQAGVSIANAHPLKIMEESGIRDEPLEDKPTS